MLGLRPLSSAPLADDGVTTQTLTATLFSNSNTFYAPTVTPGTVTVTPSLFSNTQAFYAPTVTPGTVTLSPALFGNTQAFYSPTVTPGAVTLSPSLLDNNNVFYLPTVTGGERAVSVGGGIGHGGKTRKVLLEKDGETYSFASERDLIAWLAEQRKEAAEVIEQEVEAVVVKKKPVITVKPQVVVAQTDDKWAQEKIDAYNRKIRADFDRLVAGLMLKAYMAIEAEQDDEDAILALMAA